MPVLVGSRLIGLLHTGQLFRQKRTSGQFERTATMLTKLGTGVDRGQMKNAYFAIRVMPQQQQQGEDSPVFASTLNKRAL